MTEERPTAGHNNPPEPTPFEAVESKINDLYAEARQWLDGDPVENKGQADALNNLINMISEAAKEADELRKAEAKPYDEAKAEIQTRYSILIADTKSVTGKTVMAIRAAQAALTPWLERLDAINRAEEAEALAIAHAAQERADEANFQSANLAEREEADRLAKEAKIAGYVATAAIKEKAHAKGGTGRASYLRSVYTAEITNREAFAAFLWVRRPDDTNEWLRSMASSLVAENHDREIPGVNIIETRKAV